MFFGILLEDKFGYSYNNSFGGKMNLIILVFIFYLVFIKRNGVFENILVGFLVIVGKIFLL